MNIWLINSLHVIAVLVFGAFASFGSAQTMQSLDALIQKSITPMGGFYESRMDQHINEWEGIRTAKGLNLIIDKHLASHDGDLNLACSHLLRNIQMPKEQVAATMMARARLEAVNDEEPWRLVYVLRHMEEMIDREKQGPVVVPFIAQYLTDQRFTEPQQRGEDSTPRQRRRVCDGATSALINYLEESGLCQKYDARFGDPGGHTMWAQRDQVTRAVVQLLQEKNLLPLDFWQKAPLPRQSPPSSGQSNLSPPLPKKPSDAPPATPEGVMAQEGDAPSSSWMWIALFLAGCAVAVWRWKKRERLNR